MISSQACVIRTSSTTSSVHFDVDIPSYSLPSRDIIADSIEAVRNFPRAHIRNLRPLGILVGGHGPALRREHRHPWLRQEYAWLLHGRRPPQSPYYHRIWRDHPARKASRRQVSLSSWGAHLSETMSIRLSKYGLPERRHGQHCRCTGVVRYI